jgi:adenosylhomocysteine nucleosidase
MAIDPRPRPIFIAALQREIAAVVDGWRADEKLASRHIHLYWNDDAIVACAGMGADRASLAVEAALALGPASELISVGWAGACDHDLKIGDVFRPGIVVDARTGERYFTSESDTAEESQILITVAKPAGIIEKHRLRVTYSAGAVDMEAAAVARSARARELPFCAIKAISDEADFELPDMQQFSTSSGQFREAAFGFHVAVRPTLWPPVMAMAKSSRLAGQRLRVAIEEHIQHYRERTP